MNTKDIKITISSDEEEIVLVSTGGNSWIYDFEICFDTVDDNCRTKSDAIIPKLIIKGFDDGSDDNIVAQLKKLFDWTKEKSGDSSYRKVDVEIYKGDGIVSRSFSFAQMFVVDYKEHYLADAQENKDKGCTAGTYMELYLSQKKEQIGKIETKIGGGQ